MQQTKKYYLFLAIIIALVVLSIFGYENFANANGQHHKILKLLPLGAHHNSNPLKHSVKIPILMYHHVGGFPSDANSIRKDLSIPTDSFKQEIDWLNKQGYHSITLENLYLYSQGKFTLPVKPVIFTFDDGYKDVFQNAVSILKENNFVGSFAVITQWPGQTQGTNIYASWDEITEAKKQGMEIVCHTQNHFDGTNPRFDSAYIYQNLTGCKKDLAEHGINTDVLIYPYGHYTAEYIAQAKRAGFAMGITVHGGDVINLDDLMQVPRVRVHGPETMGTFEHIISH